MRVIVPLSPKDVRLKAEAISRHQSHPTPQGDEAAELGKTVKARNRATADLLHRLGFSDYEACEGFINLSDFKKYEQI